MNDRQRILSSAAYGIHHQVAAGISSLIEDRFGHPTFFFYEHFLEKPFVKGSTVGQLLRTRQQITAPFLSRVAYQTGFLPAIDAKNTDALTKPDDIKVVPLTRDNLDAYWRDSDRMEFAVGDTELLKWLAQHWFDVKGVTNPTYLSLNRDPDKENGTISVANALSTKFLRETYPQNLILEAKNGPSESVRKSAVAKLREYELVLRPWLRSVDTEHIGIIVASISTNSIFWGQCIVLYPIEGKSDPNAGRNRLVPQDQNGIKSESDFERNLRKYLCEKVRSVYAPMLTLLENYIYEDGLKKKIEKLTKGSSSDELLKHLGIDSQWVNDRREHLLRIGSGQEEPKRWERIASPRKRIPHVFLSIVSLYLDKKHSWKQLTRLERALVELWADRIWRIADSKNPSTNLDAITDSLVFAKYLVASPTMVERIEQAAALRHMQKEKESRKSAVKTALVIGGPGSGKDSMAELIRLFSPGYRFQRKKTLNMATFRPKEAAVPLLLGLEVTRREIPTQVSIVGVLERAISEEGAKNSDGGPEGPQLTQIDEPPKVFTFIMDELNSLDMDTQGALLRLLENGELEPLGGLGAGLKNIDLLIIGVMNEDPQLIMKKRAMERVLREKQLFGGVLGEGLYEIFRRQRRLRDDLYYRFIRGGNIELPELRDRREDIPILFYFIVKRDLESLMPKSIQENHAWNIDLPVYEELMNPSLQWEGNLRELQAVARDIVIEAIDEYEKSPTLRTALAVRGAHAKKILKDYKTDIRL